MSAISDGFAAEQAVADYLVSGGYKIIDQNWKTAIAEIDIVAIKSGTIFFIEVKYRKTDFAGDGFDYVTNIKLKHMRRAAEAWVITNNWSSSYELLAAAVEGTADNFKIDLREVN